MPEQETSPDEEFNQIAERFFAGVFKEAEEKHVRSADWTDERCREEFNVPRSALVILRDKAGRYAGHVLKG
jgi:hypothetical protein